MLSLFSTALGAAQAPPVDVLAAVPHPSPAAAAVVAAAVPAGVAPVAVAPANPTRKQIADVAYMGPFEAAPQVPGLDRNNCTFVNEQWKHLSCTEEADERMQTRWIPANATVLEIGSHYGLQTCEIAGRVVKNGGRLVTVEADPNIHPILHHNMKAHNCEGAVVHGVLANKPLFIDGASRKKCPMCVSTTSSDDKMASGLELPSITLAELQATARLTRPFDVLVADCEGCLPKLIDDMPELLTGLHTVMLEEDWIDGCAKRGDCADYDKMYAKLKIAGLREVEVISSYENGLRKLVWSKNRMPAHRGPGCYVPPAKEPTHNAQYKKTISQVLTHIQDAELQEASVAAAYTEAARAYRD